jgi:putative ABC transport system permease protein
MTIPRPPRLFQRFFEWYCKDTLQETILGDLEEQFFEDLDSYGSWKAKRRFAWNVIRFFRPGIIRSIKKTQKFNTMDMFKNYVKVASRNLVRNRLYATIKISGLAIGIAACLLITLFVIEELNHDNYYPKADQIHRLINRYDDPVNSGKWTAHPPMVASMMEELFPEIEKAGRLIPYDWYFAGKNQVRRIDRIQNSYEEGFVYADQSLLEILSVPMVYGSIDNALSEPNSIVITRRKAEKYFPGEDPVGKTLILDEVEDRPWTIGGVIENFPTNSHLQPFNFFLTLAGEEFWEGEQTSWCCSNYNVYLMLQPRVDPGVLANKMKTLMTDYYVPYLEKRGDQDAENVAMYQGYELQAISDLYLKSGDIGDIIKTSDIKIVWLFGSIAIFVLLLAAINFINLSTAKSANRAKEVGLRKVVGSFRLHLIQQFLTESIIITFISVLLGIILAWGTLSLFNQIAGKSLVMPWLAWWFVPGLTALTLLVGLLSGLYPAIYLSAYSPLEVIRGRLSQGSKSSRLRGAMVVFQFTTSIILIVASIVVYRQMDFILNKELGYEKDHVLMIQGANTLGDKLESFQNELMNIPEVVSVSVSNYLPVSGTKRDQNAFWKDGRSKLDKGVGAQIWRVDKNYLETMGMKIVEGRDLDPSLVSDSSSMLINQKMAKDLGLDDPIGKKIQNWETWTVVGVVEDFHFNTIRYGIRPLAMVVGRFGDVVPIKIKTDEMQKTLASINEIWDEFMPHQPIRYNFMDDVYESMYADVARTGNVFTAFSILAIVVACMGLFGLSAFMVEQRSKEISIRKVLGASLNQIVNLLTTNFLWLILISLTIAIPIGWYLMMLWLEDFTYRIEMGWVTYLIAGAIVIIISFATVSFESIKAALINPASSLRSE